MFDKIVFISDQSANIKLNNSENITIDLMNLHLVFEDDTKKVLGEVCDIDREIVKVHFLGEIVDNKFLGGTIRKPKLDSKIRIIDKNEVLLITGNDEKGYLKVGVTPFYDNSNVYLNVNSFFSNHFAIFGNSGSGKSCGISRLFQNMFHDKKLTPYNANIFLFDSSGEYYNAFSNLNSINPNYHYRFLSTNENNSNAEKLRVPIYLFNKDDLALLLQATNHSQLPIIERMRKLALVFSQKDLDANNYKNHLIAKAIMTILYTNETAPNKRNEIFSVLNSCSTPEFNLEAVLQGVGYTRKFRECFLIDNSGNFSESVLLTEYVSSFINDSFENYEPKEDAFYNLEDLEKALNFTLISEGWLRNKNTYGDAITLKVRLHSLIVGENAKYFDIKDYMSIEKYLMLLFSSGNKYQIVNVNLDGVDDDFAKVITKVFSRFVFDYCKGFDGRNSMPFHIIVEEAHRYIQNDIDRFLIGYNIFERIAKEGRKYGAILGLISQRPVELSDTVISQCSNFLIFKMNHPVDVDYIRKMVPNINDEIVEKQKNLQAGTCLGFGAAFKIPMIIKMEMPDPAPWSGNCDVVSYWNGGQISSTDISVSNDPISKISISSLSSFDDNNSDDSPPELIKTLDSFDFSAGGFGTASSNNSGVEENNNSSLNNGDSVNISSGSGGFISTLSTDINKKSAMTDTGVPLISLLDSDELDDYQSTMNINNETNLMSVIPQVQNLVGTGMANNNDNIVSNVNSSSALEIPSFATSNFEDDGDDEFDFVNAPTFDTSKNFVNDDLSFKAEHYKAGNSSDKNDSRSLDLNLPMTSVESFIELADGKQKLESDNFDSISPVDMNINNSNDSFDLPNMNLDMVNDFSSISPINNSEDNEKVVVPLVSFID